MNATHEEMVREWAEHHGMELDGRHIVHNGRNMLRFDRFGSLVVWTKCNTLLGDPVEVRDDEAHSLHVSSIEKKRKYDDWLVTMGPWGEKLYAKGIENNE